MSPAIAIVVVAGLGLWLFVSVVRATTSRVATQRRERLRIYLRQLAAERRIHEQTQAAAQRMLEAAREASRHSGSDA